VCNSGWATVGARWPRGGGGFQPAAVVRGYTGTQTFNSTNARSDITESSICGVAGGASEWITIVMEETGTLFINTDGSSNDTVIECEVHFANRCLLLRYGERMR
jgi:hypothetical protein